jgi:hypothetical protein
MWPGASQVPQQALLAQYQASHVQQQAAQAAQAQAYAQAQAHAQSPDSSQASGQWPSSVPDIYTTAAGTPYWDPQSLVSHVQQQAAQAAQAQAYAQAQAHALHLQAQSPGSSQASGQWSSSVPDIYTTAAGTPYWDPQSLVSTFSTMTLNQPQQNEWHFDSGATSHMASDSAFLSHTFSQRYLVPSNLVVGDGSLLGHFHWFCTTSI